MGLVNWFIILFRWYLLGIECIVLIWSFDDVCIFIIDFWIFWNIIVIGFLNEIEDIYFIYLLYNG